MREGDRGGGRAGLGVFGALKIDPIVLVVLFPERTGSFKSEGLVVAPRLVARPDARPSLRSGLFLCYYEDMNSRVIAARGTDMVRELVRRVTDGRTRVESGDVVIPLDDWARVVGDVWRNET